MYVYKILEEGAAAQSDLREKDIITRVDGQSVRNMTDLQELLACYEMGEQIDLTVQSQKDGEYQERTVTITLKAMPPGEYGNTGPITKFSNNVNENASSCLGKHFVIYFTLSGGTMERPGTPFNREEN